MLNNFLTQHISIPTRKEKNNILDLMISNNEQIAYDVSTSSTELSDHKLVDILLPSGFLSPECITPTANNEAQLKDFRALDLFKADFNQINAALADVDWNTLWHNSSLDEFPLVLKNTVLDIVRKFCPLKKIGRFNNKFHCKNIYSLSRKKRKLAGRLEALRKLHPSSPKIEQLESKLSKIHEEIKSQIVNNSMKKEKSAISKIKSDPKFFYSYAKSRRKVKSSINQLFQEDGSITTHSKEMADILQNTFMKSFSDPKSSKKKIPNLKTVNFTDILDSIHLEIKDIVDAIDEMNINSACADNTLPSLVLKKCKLELAKPLLLLWNESFSIGKIPKMYKHQVITPIFKKGSKAIPSNYRPVSLTPHEIKIFERVLRKKILHHMDSQNLITCRQHGFRKGRSCLTQLMAHFDNILRNAMSSEETDSIYLDFAKAFDKVDHEILLKKLKMYGITGRVYNWIADFLSNRTQEVVINGFSSFIAMVISGVPQGTVLGPILFLIFLNDMEQCIEQSTVGFFADDTRLSKSIAIADDSKLLQNDLDQVIKWSEENNMSLHVDKFIYMNFHTARSRPLTELPFQNQYFEYFTSNSQSLLPDNSVKDLGVTLSPTLSWHPHSLELVKKSNSHAGWVLSSFHSRSPSTMKTLYKSLIRSHLEYSCPLWVGLQIGDAMLIEGVQRRFTSRMAFGKKLNYWERLSILNLMSLQRRRERYVILQMWKTLHGNISNDLNVSFYYNPRLGFRASVPTPFGKNYRARSLYDSSFAVKGPLLFNVLPKEINSLETLETFKFKLDEFLKSFPDCPPVQGYAAPNQNSLLDWNSCKRF